MKKSKAMAWLLAAGMALSACPMVALAEPEVPQPKASAAVFGTPSTVYDKTGAELGNVVFTPTAENVAVTGKLNYVKGYTGFSTNAEEQEGYFLAFDIKPGQDIVPTDEKTIELSTYDGDAAKNAQLTKDGFLVMRIVRGADFTVSVDWDGEGTAYEKTTYSFDLSKLGRQSLATFEEPDAQLDLFGKHVDDLQDVVIGEDGKVTGTLKFISDYTQFSSNEKEQSGNFFAFTVKAPEGVTMNDEKVVLKMVTSSGNTMAIDKADGTIVLIMNTLNPFKVVVDWDGEEAKYAESEYTIDPSALKLEGRLTPGMDSEVKVENGYVSEVKAGTNAADLAAALQGNGGDVKVVAANGDALADDAKVGTGCKVLVVKDDQTLEEVVVVIAGDINGDGEIQVLDATRLLNGLFPDAGEELTGAYEQAAKLTGEAISVQDAVKLLNMVVPDVVA